MLISFKILFCNNSKEDYNRVGNIQINMIGDTLKLAMAATE